MKKLKFAAKRDKASKKRTIALYKDVLEVLEQAIALEKEGKKEQSDQMVEDMKKKLASMLTDMEKDTKKQTDIALDRSNIPQRGAVLAEDEKVILKMLSEEEYTSYIDVSFECSDMKSAFKEGAFKQDLWNEFKSDYTVAASIYDKVSGEYVGYCSVKDIRKEDWEIAIEEKEKYRHQGYGFHALDLFIKKIHELTQHRFFRARIDIDNIASQNLWKKLGGYPDGISEFLLHGEDLEEFQRENISEIDDSIRKIAEEFCVEPEDLIGHVLEFRLDALKNKYGATLKDMES